MFTQTGCNYCSLFANLERNNINLINNCRFKKLPSNKNALAIFGQPHIAACKMPLYLNADMKVFTIKNILLYAAAIAGILALLQWMQFKLLVIDHATEIYITAIAVIFTVIGMWLAKKLMRPKTEVVKETVVVEKEVTVYRPPHELFLPDTQMISKFGISQREMEVLQLMAAGATNQEIADQLFVSLNTIKTHTSRLFEKLDVKRRTQAIEKAKRLNIIP